MIQWYQNLGIIARFSVRLSQTVAECHSYSHTFITATFNALIHHIIHTVMTVDSFNSYHMTCNTTTYSDTNNFVVYL